MENYGNANSKRRDKGEYLGSLKKRTSAAGNTYMSGFIDNCRVYGEWDKNYETLRLFKQQPREKTQQLPKPANSAKIHYKPFDDEIPF